MPAQPIYLRCSAKKNCIARIFWLAFCRSRFLSTLFLTSLVLTSLFLAPSLTVSSAGAAEKISLADYLKLADTAGIQTLYSSDLVPGYYNVIYDPDNTITLAQVEKALASFKLALQAIGVNSYAVVRLDVRLVEGEPKLELAPSTDVEPPKIEELVVTSSRYKLVVQRGQSSMKISNLEILLRPAVGNDAVRLVASLPGSASNGVSARPRVRGGQRNETLIQFDGVRLYNPFHFQNFNQLFGSFDTRIIEEIEFSSGGFSARNGDRLSAVMDIVPRDTQDLLATREIGLGIFNASYLQAGGSDEGDWLFDLRRSTTELVAGFSEQDLGKPSFADMFARYRWNLLGKHQLSANLFWFGDDMSLRNSSGSEAASNIYGNTYLWLKVTSELSSALNITSLVSFSGIKNDRTGFVSKPGIVKGNLKDDREFRVYNVKQEAEYLKDESLLFEFGWDYRYLDASYQFDSELILDPLFQTVSNYLRPTTVASGVVETGHQYSSYFNSKWSPVESWVMTLGLRIDGQHYERSLKEVQISPRVGVLFRPMQKTTLRASWGRYSQADGVHELKINDGITMFQPIQKNEQVIFGVEQRLPADFNLRVEAYKKYGTDVNPYYVNLSNSLSLVPELQFDRFEVAPEEYDSRGVEVSVEGTLRDIAIWANYSISRTEDVLAGNKVKRSWDQTHAGNLGVAFTHRDWQVSFSGSFHNGWLTTPVRLENNAIVVDDRNSSGLGDYRSLDVKVTRQWNLGEQTLRLEAGITNLLNRKNEVGTEYELRNGVLESRDKSGLPLVPFFDIYWRF